MQWAGFSTAHAKPVIKFPKTQSETNKIDQNYTIVNEFWEELQESFGKA